MLGRAAHAAAPQTLPGFVRFPEEPVVEEIDTVQERRALDEALGGHERHFACVVHRAWRATGEEGALREGQRAVARWGRSVHARIIVGRVARTALLPVARGSILPPMASKTEDAVAELFTKRPGSLDELAQRLDNLSRKHTVRLLVERLSSEGLPQQDLDLVRDALGIVGVGQDVDRLCAIAADPNRSEEVRGVAFLVLSTGSQPTFAALEKRVTAAEIGKLEEAAVAHDLRRMRAEPARAELVSSVLRRAEDDADFLRRLERLEAQRKQIGLPAALAYGDALYHFEIPLERIDHLIALVEDEDCFETVDTFAQVLVMVEELPARERLREPWMRARAKRAQPLGGEAWVSAPDSEGVVGAFGWFDDEPREGKPKTQTLVEVTYGEQGIVSTRMEPWAEPDFVQSFLDEIADQTGVDFEESELPAAAKLVAEAAAKGQTMEHEPALTMFRVYGGAK